MMTGTGLTDTGALSTSVCQVPIHLTFEALLLLFLWISYIFLLIVSAYFVGLLLLLYYFTSCVQTGDEDLQFSCLHMKVLHISSDILEELRHPQVAAKCSVGLIIFL